MRTVKGWAAESIVDGGEKNTDGEGICKDSAIAW